MRRRCGRRQRPPGGHPLGGEAPRQARHLRPIAARVGALGRWRDALAAVALVEPGERGVRVAQAVAQLAQELRPLGLERQIARGWIGGFQNGARLLDRAVAPGELCRAQGHMGVAGAGRTCGGDRRAQLVEPVGLLQQAAKIVVRRGVLGGARQRPAVARDRGRVVPQVAQRHPQVAVRLGEIRPEGQRRPIRRSRIARAVLLPQDVAQVVVRLGEIGVASQRRAEALGGAFELARVNRNVAHDVGCHGMPRIGRLDGGAKRAGTVVVALAHGREGRVDGGRKIRLGPRCLRHDGLAFGP